MDAHQGTRLTQTNYQRSSAAMLKENCTMSTKTDLPGDSALLQNDLSSPAPLSRSPVKYTTPLFFYNQHVRHLRRASRPETSYNIPCEAA